MRYNCARNEEKKERSPFSLVVLVCQSSFITMNRNVNVTAVCLAKSSDTVVSERERERAVSSSHEKKPEENAKEVCHCAGQPWGKAITGSRSVWRYHHRFLHVGTVSEVKSKLTKNNDGDKPDTISSLSSRRRIHQWLVSSDRAHARVAEQVR